MIKNEERQSKCDQHGDFLSKRSSYLNLQGEAWTDWEVCPVCNEITKKAEEEERKKAVKLMNDKIQRNNLGFSTIPKRFREKRFDDWIADDERMEKIKTLCKRYSGNFEAVLAKGISMVLCGSVGTGKTHLAAAIANSIIDSGHSVQFVSVLSVVKAVKETWSDRELKERDVLRVLEDCDLLILDEVGAQFGSDTEKLIIFDLINSRYEDVKPTVIISNLAEDDLSLYIGERTLDRLKEGGGPVFGFDWKSKRGEK